jgi:aspartyl-tRNA(Asn)/glutamyl-tRNA(Gln) amidotransferase subunit C
MSKLSRDDVLKLAQLSRIKLTDDEADEFTGEISEILQYVEQLQNADVAGLEPTSQITGLTNVSRPDEKIDYGYKPSDLFKNLPAVQDNQIKVRKMLG